MEMLRRQFGIAEPIRRGMELKIATAGEWRPAVLGGASGVHRDILEGRDCEIGWEDVFVGKLGTLFAQRYLHETPRYMVANHSYPQATSSAKCQTSTPRWRPR